MDPVPCSRPPAATASPRWARPLPAIGLLLGLLGAIARPGAGQEVTTSPHGRLENDCADCHRDDGWRPLLTRPRFEHKATGFPLLGAHGSANCRGCHAELSFANAPTRCAGCHQDVHRGELGESCGTCHVERSFLDRGRMVQLHQTTRFVLTGTHRAADCESCHPRAGQGRLQFVGRPTDCQSCHVAQYSAARNPDHQAAGFSLACDRCHAVTFWASARFNHSSGGFPLTGAHRALACEQCHTGNVFNGAPSTCVSCHQADYDQTTAPNHAQAQFPTDCAACHSTRAWDATFDHSRTGFALTGEHRTTSCQQCHGDGVYNGKPTACEGCHLPDFTSAANPNHQQLGWPTTCTTCHSGSKNTAGWDQGVNLPRQYHSMFNVDHKSANGRCDRCHNPPVYQPAFCTDCHRASCTFQNQGGCDD